MKKLRIKQHLLVALIYEYWWVDEDYDPTKIKGFTLLFTFLFSFIVSIIPSTLGVWLLIDVIDFTSLYLTSNFLFLLLSIIVNFSSLFFLIIWFIDVMVSINNHIINLLDTRYSLKRGVKK